MTMQALITLVLRFAKIFISVSDIIIQVAPVAAEVKKDYAELRETISKFTSGEEELTDESFKTLLEQTEILQNRLDSLRSTE